ncbi:MAG: hypothetical protein Q9190_003039 [Brigantiaea leucoxantha]
MVSNPWYEYPKLQHPAIDLFFIESTSKKPCLRSRPFSTSRSSHKTTHKTRLNYEDAYAFHHARQRKAANVARQADLREQREAARGDPIRGITTPFIESLDSATSRESRASIDEVSHRVDINTPDEEPPSPAKVPEETYLGHFLTQSELEESLEYSRKLSEPPINLNRAIADPAQEAADAREHAARDRIAREAVLRIVDLSNTSSKERLRANTRRIIDTFGRHNTDKHLKPKAAAAQSANSQLEPTPRVGPDTGSSEVQIGILTAKIRVLADKYEGENRNDKVNKRNLRLLLHRRQKLLRYMRQKERGSDRWFKLIETLGLTEATWKGQIEVR